MIVALALGVLVQAKAQENDRLARVQKIQGKEVYILSEPVRSYETVRSIRTSPKWMSILTRGVINEHVNDKSAQFVWKAGRKLKRKGVDFDALLYVDGKKINVIKFTEEATSENEGIAKVKSIKGVNTFVLAEPLDDYSVVKKVYTGVKVIPFLTYGLINNSIERDIKTLAKKTNKKTDSVNVIYTTGRTGTIVSFN